VLVVVLVVGDGRVESEWCSRGVRRREVVLSVDRSSIR
jgi:hypothetical protein